MIRRYHYCMGYTSEYVCYDGSDVKKIYTLDATLRRICRDLEIPAFNSHLIRKTVATTLHDAGMPTKEISELLGHEEMNTTENNYIISMRNSIELMRNRMETALFKK